MRYRMRMNARIVPADFTMFVPAFTHFHSPIDFRLALEGEGTRTRCTDILISGNEQTLLLKAQGMVNHWNRKEDLYLFGNVSQLDADSLGLSWLFHNLSGKDEVPAIIRRLGDIRFNGDISGYLHQLTTHGSVLSKAGRIQANVTMHSHNDTAYRSYSGKVSSRRLNLGTLLGKEQTFGDTAFDITMGRRAGAHTCGVTYGNGTLRELEQSGAECVIDDFSALPDVISRTAAKQVSDAQ